jgi:hypothetical protein
MWLQQANALAAVANFDFAQVKDFEMEPMLQGKNLNDFVFAQNP